jgi:tripartite-type tricarboxylate transporter receptor subunit TctC
MTPAPMKSAEFAAFVAEERKKWAEVVKTLGAKVD